MKPKKETKRPNLCKSFPIETLAGVPHQHLKGRSLAQRFVVLQRQIRAKDLEIQHRHLLAVVVGPK